MREEGSLEKFVAEGQGPKIRIASNSEQARLVPAVCVQFKQSAPSFSPPSFSRLSPSRVAAPSPGQRQPPPRPRRQHHMRAAAQQTSKPKATGGWGSIFQDEPQHEPKPTKPQTVPPRAHTMPAAHALGHVQIHIFTCPDVAVPVPFRRISQTGMGLSNRENCDIFPDT